MTGLQVTELLYTKQTQLERMAAEKAAQQLAHERQVAQAKDDAERVKRCECQLLHTWMHIAMFVFACHMSFSQNDWTL